MENTFDVTIIGAGPAGLTAAIYARRANLTTAVIEYGVAGGKLYNTYEIDNYPGFKKVSGAELGDQLAEHAKKYNAQFVNGKVTSINKNGNTFEVKLETGEIVLSKTVIVATGTKEKKLELEHADEYIGNGISYCAVCDGFFYKNKDVVVIGGGNSALEEALYLTSIVNKVYIVIRRDEFRADASVVKEIMSNPKIQIITKSLPDSLIINEGSISGINVKHVETGSITPISCSGIFPYIGALPETSFVSSEVLNESKYIIANDKMETKIPGLYAAGDVIVKNLRQVITACNDGAIAATNVSKYIKENH